MKTTHTLGLWTVEYTSGGVAKIKSNDGHGFIATVRFRPTKTDNLAERDANAHLIAAAPKLLEALKDIVHADDTGMGRKPKALRILLAKDAIEMAEGSQ